MTTTDYDNNTRLFLNDPTTDISPPTPLAIYKGEMQLSSTDPAL
jgi:hypothetical protein